MEPVEKDRRILGNPPTYGRFRRSLIGVLVLFGIGNVILVVLYPQIYSGDLLGKLNPTASKNYSDKGIEKIAEVKHRIFSFENKDTSKVIDLAESEKKISNQRTPNEISEATNSEDVEDLLDFSSTKNLKNLTTKDSQHVNNDTPSSLKTEAPKPSQPVTKRDALKSPTKSTVTQNSSKRLNTNALTESHRMINVTSKFQNNNASISGQTSTDQKEVTSKKIESFKPRVPTKQPGQKIPTNAFNISKKTTSFQPRAVEEPHCKPHILSAAAIEYTTRKYAIRPEVLQCKDQKAPPYELCVVNETKTNDSFTDFIIKCDFSVCDRTKPMSIEYMDYRDGLMKKQDIPTTLKGGEIEKMVAKLAKDVRKHDLPFLFVNCSGKLTNVVVAQILTFLPSMPVLKDVKTRNKININIFLVDSVSRKHFYRSFPKTTKYLEETAKESDFPAHIFNFELFQAVHGHTNENERALFNGSILHRRGTARDRTPVNLEPLYGVFKKAGFQTMFLDDLCWRAIWGIMDKYKVSNWNVLQDKLRVSSIDTRGISESSCMILKRNKMKLPFYAKPKHQICFNGRHQHEYVLEYLTKYLDAIRSTPQSKPLFSYTSTHVSHDDGGIRVQTLDAHLKDFIHQMTARTNTLSIVFADHGNTYTGYQAMADGKQEMFHPFMLMVVPKALGKRFGGEVLRNLYENKKRLFNLFDLRAGLVELSSYNGESPLKPTGIFGKIAPNRTCEELLITADSKCICQGWEAAVPTTKDHLVFAEFAIGEINNKIKDSLLKMRAKGVPFTKTGVLFGACQRLRVQKITNVKTRKTKDGMKTITIDVRLQSSNLLDQEELITVQVAHKENNAGSYEMSLVSKNRVSTYGPYRTCKDESVDVKTCICNDPKDPKPPTALEDVVGKNSKITKLDRCLYKILRTYNGSKNEPLVKVYELVNVCRDEEFKVTLDVLPGKAIFSTKTPISVTLRPQTIQFVASARIIGKTKSDETNIIWNVESKKSA
ncbi:uncharacterized protein LOC114523731 [Dendronephthya gigantea]|uniref:uncharacterized protein LOC114523731 n=1 Tax=Dendronephthya gigantea TaxID=151771 RepID=UPI00106C040D|nr:uncharacterized protein LOC114523731 [Dendronephthya gigantea]XP_028400551.1 uncharacterized protein LOC114523731 [Dendronephthya gigantea]XP_028400552.1 uncharacterized protein LOC114523731 [Dendronephthya gigantea]